MQADPAETGIEGLAYINTLWAAYEPVDPKATFKATRMMGGKEVEYDARLCDFTVPQFQQKDNDSYYRYYSKHRPTEERLRCLKFKSLSKDTEAKADVTDYLDAGFALSTLYCRTFFRRITTHVQQRGFVRNDINDAGTAISAILGLASVGSGVVGGVGTAFGLSDSVFRTYDQQFLVSADLPTVQKAVEKAQSDFAATIYKKLPTSYPEAATAVATHADYCSFLGMKTLVNNSVAQATKQGTAASDPDVATGAKPADSTTVASPTARQLALKDAQDRLTKAQKASVAALAMPDDTADAHEKRRKAITDAEQAIWITRAQVAACQAAVDAEAIKSAKRKS